MGAVTYPNEKVASFIMQHMVPIQVSADSPLAKDFRVNWTPTIIVLDFYGREHHRVVGYLPPEEFIPALLLGMGKIDFDVEQFNDAISISTRCSPSIRTAMPHPKQLISAA